jgi:hypothetical protein
MHPKKGFAKKSITFSMSFLFLEIVIFEISVALFFFYTQIDPI